MGIKNLYPGVNPHLNSALQSSGGDWEMFHARFIEKIVDELENTLPPGYYAKNEKSLQIRVIDPHTSTPLLVRPDTNIPDVMVYHQRTVQSSASAMTAGKMPTLIFPVNAEFDEEDELQGVVIYRPDPDNTRGKPITRFELLSPANKPGGSYYLQYLRKRQNTLIAGLRLVEIDLLHETRPLLRRIPDYTAREAQAYPYTILVSDPRPDIHAGQTRVYGFGLDAVLPAIVVPLEDKDTVVVDFSQIYNQTFENRRAFELLVDYTREPERFETYSEADQAFIREKMKEIAGVA